MKVNNGLNKYELASYLKELKLLSCSGDVDKSKLSSLAEVEAIRYKASHLDDLPVKKFTLDFNELSSGGGIELKRQLSKNNNSAVYLWTPRTNSCGLYSVQSIDDVNFKFPFNVNSEGIVVIMSTNLEDKLLLDFYRNSEGKEEVEVEVIGKNWSNLDIG
jgi:hypothetical protein